MLGLSAESHFILKLRSTWFHAINMDTGSLLPEMPSRWPCDDAKQNGDTTVQ